jgi:hypothetical protein
MKKTHFTVLICCITLAILLIAATLFLTHPTTRSRLRTRIMLYPLLNPGFEAGFYESGGVGELTVADHWYPWWDPSGDMHRPEYKAETTSTGRARIRTGLAAQKLFTTFSPHHAGVAQEVHDVTPGRWYTFSAWAYQWSSAHHDPDRSQDDGKCSVLVGINPWGDADPRARTTVWGREALQVYDRWTRITVTAQAWSEKITVAIAQVCAWPVCHNDAYLDDAHLELADVGPEVTAAPTYTPYPTYTPPPPATPCPASGTCPTIDDIRQIFRSELGNIAIQVEVLP